MAEKKTKVNINDVAAAANVSIATVSRAINNKESVKESTYRRVFKAIRELGYDNFIAKHDSKLLLILLPDMENPFYAKVIKGISSAASRHGYQDIIVRTGSRSLTQTFIEGLVSTTHAEGVITLDPIRSTETLDALIEKFPMVQCAEYNLSSDISYVSIDDVAAARSVVEYMLSKGKKRIALINGPGKYKYARKRQEGFVKALNQAGIVPEPNLIIQLPEFSYDAAISVATQLLTMTDRPDAIFGASDMFAVAAINVAKRMGLSIPQDLGVIGFDNTHIAIMSDPPLTTVQQPQFQLGFIACEMLIDQITNVNYTHRSVVLDVELIIRESL